MNMGYGDWTKFTQEPKHDARFWLIFIKIQFEERPINFNRAFLGVRKHIRTFLKGGK